MNKYCKNCNNCEKYYQELEKQTTKHQLQKLKQELKEVFKSSELYVLLKSLLKWINKILGV